MIDISAWMELFQKNLSEHFGERIWFVGLQGSYGRGEATESSDKYHLGVAAPILCQGDLMGCVMLLQDESTTAMAESDQRLAQTVAGFLGKQMET